MDETNNKARLPELDTLRGIAALSVCFFHFFALYGFFGNRFLKYGCTGVDLFFLISGFVIFMSLSKMQRLKDFWITRFYRLYPAYWISIIVALVTFYFFSKIDFNTHFKFLLGNFLMVQPVLKVPVLVGAYWTLYVELCFYIFISIIWYLKKMDRIENIAIACLLLMIILNGLYTICKTPLYTAFFVNVRRLCPLLSYLNMFAAGFIFYRIYTGGFTTKRVLILITCFAATALSHDFDGHIKHFLSISEHLFYDAIYFILFLLLVLKKLPFTSAVGTFFGTISYSLYLVHQSNRG